MGAYARAERAEAIPRPIRRLIEFAESCRAAGEPFNDRSYAEASGLAPTSVRTYCRVAVRRGWWPDGIEIVFEDRPVRLFGGRTFIRTSRPDTKSAALEIARQLLPLYQSERATALETAAKLLHYLESAEN